MKRKNLQVKLKITQQIIPLPQLLAKRQQCQAYPAWYDRNIPVYISTFVDSHSSSMLNELRKSKHYQANGCNPYSPKITGNALLLRFTSAQSYKLLLENFFLFLYFLYSKTTQERFSWLKRCITSVLCIYLHWVDCISCSWLHRNRHGKIA